MAAAARRRFYGSTIKAPQRSRTLEARSSTREAIRSSSVSSGLVASSEALREIRPRNRPKARPRLAWTADHPAVLCSERRPALAALQSRRPAARAGGGGPLARRLGGP